MTDPVRVTEALPGGRMLNELRDLVNKKAQSTFGADQDGRWVYVSDMSDTVAIVEITGAGTPEPGYYQVAWSIDDAGGIALGEPAAVEPRTTYEVTESTIPGRLLEAKGTDAAGGRVFAFRIVEGGTVGRNRRRYPAAVLAAAAPLYEGAKCFDRHRTTEELRSSTILGLVGGWQGVRVVEGGLDADLHLLPSATHTAEALDASLAAQAAGQPPLVGASHDVLGRFRVVVEGGQRVEDATEIASVNSVDVVADPAAGGRVTRMVAGGIEPPEPKESPMDLEALIKLANDATDEQKASLAGALGIKAAAPSPTPTPTPPAPSPASTTGAPAAGAAAATPAPVSSEMALTGVAEGGLFAKDTLLGGFVVNAALAQAGVPPAFIQRASEAVVPALPERFTEAQLLDLLKMFAPRFEAAGLKPTVPDVTVAKESHDKKVDAVHAMFAGDFRKGYRSVREAFIDFTGVDVRKYFGPASEDFNRHMFRESMMVVREGGRPGFYDSGMTRATESVNTTTWGELFGDAMHKRMIAEYGLQQLNSWRKIVSSILPVADFRDQKPMRMGGYGTLPIVPENAPYQALTTPPDEQVPWSVDKRGGFEDWTFEAAANDDMRRLLEIPRKLGRTAAQTLYRFVWDFLRLNPTMIYDSTALFAAGHSNTDTGAALGQTTLSTGRRKMRLQTAYGDSAEVLGAVPKFLVVPSSLEEMAFKLVTSAVAITSNANSTEPNIHQGMEPIVLDYLTDQDDWFIVADPASVPTIELGFYQGREDPELFTQADPTQGALFDADVFRLKIRHIYGGTWLDHRSAYRGQA